MQNADDILSRAGMAKYFTVIDLNKGFLQIPMAGSDKEKTAFHTHKGLWQFTVMPFGLRNAPATFQRFIDKVLGDTAMVFAEGFVDDVLIYSASIEEYIMHCREIFLRLVEAGLSIHLEKIRICTQEVKYLGHIITPGKVLPNPDKARVVKEFPTPKNVKNIQQFLGLASYYRKFVPKFSNHFRPLSDLTIKDREWTWGVVEVDAFEAIKDALVKTAGTSLPDLDKEFVIQTDASGVGLGAVLLQNHDGV